MNWWREQTTRGTGNAMTQIAIESMKRRNGSHGNAPAISVLFKISLNIVTLNIIVQGLPLLKDYANECVYD